MARLSLILALIPAAMGLVLTGHRGGMSGSNSYVPEHSKAAYALGASYGATYIEPDVISTKDNVLMVMHRNELGRTSDVDKHPEFADRYTTKVIDDGDGCGTNVVTGWFSEDFTWDEVATLRLKATSFDGQGPLDGIYSFLKFEEMLDYVADLAGQQGRPIGVYPETKLANYFASLGLPLEGKLMDTIAAHGYCGYEPGGTFCAAAMGSNAPGPILLQSFSPESLQILNNVTDLTRVQLAQGDAMGKAKVSPLEQLQFVATYAQAISIPTSWDEDFFDETVNMALTETPLKVHAWVTETDAALYTRLANLGVENAFSNNIPFGEGALKEAQLANQTWA